MLARIEHLPDESALKTAMRDGDWSHDQHLMAAIFNEVRMSRADYANVHSERPSKPELLRSPAALKEEAAQEDFHTMLHDAMVAQATGVYTPPARDSVYVIENKGGADVR